MNIQDFRKHEARAELVSRLRRDASGRLLPTSRGRPGTGEKLKGLASLKERLERGEAKGIALSPRTLRKRADKAALAVRPPQGLSAVGPQVGLRAAMIAAGIIQ